jgi:hypothetical protein
MGRAVANVDAIGPSSAGKACHPIFLHPSTLHPPPFTHAWCYPASTATTG